MRISRRTIAISLTVLLSSIVIAKSLHFTFIYGGTDLRCRVVGSRLTTTQHSPYYYKWDSRDGAYYLDPNDHRDRVVNGNVATPAVLYLINPLANLPYHDIRIIWTLLQFVIAAGSIYLLSKSSKSDHPAWLSPVIITIVAFICSDLWLYNIERGQIYILYVLLFSIMYSLYTRRWKASHFLSGLVGGLFIFFRPIALVAVIGFLIQRNYKWLLGAVTGLIVGAVLFIAPHPQHWKDYLSAMTEYSSSAGENTTKIESSPSNQLPVLIENTDNITTYRHFTSGGLLTLQNYLSRVGISIGNFSTAIYGLIAAGLAFLFLKEKNTNVSSDQAFLFGFLLYLLAELFMTAPRAGYNVIQWIFPLFIAWKYILRDRLLLTLCFTGILFLHHFPFLFPYQNDIAELIFIAIILFIVFPSLRPHIALKRDKE